MFIHRVIAVFVLLVAAAPAWAGLVEKYFPGKTEAVVAAEFEAGLSDSLTARLKEPAIFVRMYAPVAKNTEVHVQLTAVNGGSTTWMTLVNIGWRRETCEYSLEPMGKEYTFEISKLPPAEVANWYPARGRPALEVVACACWLAGRGELWLANGQVSALAALNAETRSDVEEWLAAKHGWKVPSDGLMPLATHDLKHRQDGTLLVTPEGKAAWLKLLDTELKDELKVLQNLQGNDVKSKPGSRKGSPGMRLEMLQKHVEHFGLTYAGTPFMEKKGAKELQLIAEAVKADIEWVEAESFKAARKGMEKDWPGAAKHYELILRADPLNPELLQSTAEAFNKAAEIVSARQCGDPAAAKKSAMLFEELIVIYPKALGYRNYAGVGWLAAGEKTRAREHHEEVVRRTDKKELSDTEKLNREFAEGQLKLIK